MKNEDKFNFWLPIDLVEKAKGNLNKDDDSRYDNMILRDWQVMIVLIGRVKRWNLTVLY